MTNPTQQNKEIMESFSGKFLGVWVDKKDIEQFLLSALEQKDQEKEKALIEQESNFLNQKANQHDQAVREKALQKVKSAAKKVLDELEYTQFIMALEDEFEINIDN